MSLARGTERKKQITLAKNMMLIVMTDFMCWLPIIAMGKYDEFVSWLPIIAMGENGDFV